MPRSIDKPVTFGVVVGSREFFNGAPALAIRAEIQLAALGIWGVSLPAEETLNGAVQSRADARLYADFFRSRRDDIDGLVILLPNFGDEIAIAELVDLARLDVPILLQASNDARSTGCDRRPGVVCSVSIVVESSSRYSFCVISSARRSRRSP